MKNIFVLCLLLCCFQPLFSQTNHREKVLDQLEKHINRFQKAAAQQLLEAEIKDQKTSAEDLSFYYAQLSSLYLSNDSLRLGKLYADKAIAEAEKTADPAAKAMAKRASAYLKSYLNQTDEVIQEVLEALKLLEDSKEEYDLKYNLNYLLYASYSGWNDADKMEEYIRECEKYAQLSANHNQQANVELGYSSVFLLRYRKDKKRSDLEQNEKHLQAAYRIAEQFPQDVSGNTLVMAVVNLANYYLELSTAPLPARKERAYFYLAKAEEELRNNRAQFGRWVNIYGIKSSFALLEGNTSVAEQYLLDAVKLISERKDNSLLKLEYQLYKQLSDISAQKKDFSQALTYRKKAEELLITNFNQTQIANSQKLEIQYDTEKKDQQLKLLAETSELRNKLNYLYGGVAILAVLGLAFLFRSYKFKLQYSLAREKQLAREKADAEQHALMQVKLEKEEQGRLKAEQELLELKHQQLQKEALANSLLIDHKNDMLKQIKSKLQEGDANQAQKLLKEETLMNADFEDIKWQIQQLHPNFFQQLVERSTQKLTALDLKYCAYLYLQMSTKQIAQVLHVEAQSVRMFKYRLKQKFGLPKESDLETFLHEISA